MILVWKLSLFLLRQKMRIEVTLMRKYNIFNKIDNKNGK